MMRNDQFNLNKHKLNTQGKETEFEISTTGYGLESVVESNETNTLEEKQNNGSSEISTLE
ncbi:hypothetical protein RRV45_12890 [Bacillus sp. DTU_2020_1000418_1_SI_GHA_SEK_038]|uniref:hypothetical protein n=1 Tax=Bacillus sp. DTU_2020_1000418_1_SI_GHA_SEK_038 TaxID=3077585 RepID=UPI0028EEBF22|nr:hypothetical protein [Bacillus sp. DTU_2020_1000418_1_SI_GHA_SEK_038]WNS73814.1 hypothetical protein RRV45_12890 [Bacillus sp. DTU_2020_1000418_1_SI_GHA_SEK_038]